MTGTNKQEKQRCKLLLKKLQNKGGGEFEKSLPMGKAFFQDLFDFLDEQLSEYECDESTGLTEAYLDHNRIDNKEEVLKWLAEKGGYCDCEILANVEEYF